jgi:hypothetical protein
LIREILGTLFWIIFSTLPRFGPLLPGVFLCIYRSLCPFFFPHQSRVHFFYSRKTEQSPVERLFS